MRQQQTDFSAWFKRLLELSHELDYPNVEIGKPIPYGGLSVYGPVCEGNKSIGMSLSRRYIVWELRDHLRACPVKRLKRAA